MAAFECDDSSKTCYDTFHSVGFPLVPLIVAVSITPNNITLTNTSRWVHVCT